MADSKDNLLSSIDVILKAFGSGMATVDWKSMCSTFLEFWELLQTLTTASEESIAVRHKAYTAVFQVKNSLQDILDESSTHRSTHQQSFDIFNRMENLIRFEQTSLDQFLSEHSLSQYRELFAAEGIVYAGELLDAPNVEEICKSNMKTVPFNRMQKAIKRMNRYREYIQTQLEGDMKAMEARFSASSDVIHRKLLSFMEILEPVIQEIAEVVKDETKRLVLITGAAVFTVVMLGLSVACPGVGCLCFGIKGLITVFSAGTLTCAAAAPPVAATAVGVTGLAATGAITAVGGYGIHKVRKDKQEHLDQLQDTQSMVTGWQQALHTQFLHWRELVGTFKCLFEELSRNHEQYKDQQDDLELLLGRTKDLLKDAIVQTETFEKLVRDLKNKEIERV
ncbi:uncharacterized protein LOC144443566 [Glandiceps talaboti]